MIGSSLASLRTGLRAALCAALALLAGVLPARAQTQDERWQAHTSLREVVDVAAAGADLWAATSGGVFRFTPASGEVRSYTASDGLHDVQTRAVAYDARRDQVWIGYPDGVLDRLSPETGAVRSFLDIARAERFTARGIHRLVAAGDSLLVATAFGLVVFDPVRGEVRDTYSQFGALAPGTPVYDVVFAPTPSGAPGLWLATGAGVAYAATATANLQDPRAWTVETTGLPSPDARALAYFGGNVYVGTAQGLAVRSGTMYLNLGVSGSAVTDLAATPALLFGVDAGAVITVDAARSARRLVVPGYGAPRTVLPGADGQVWLGDAEGGLLAVQVPPPPATTATVAREGVYPEGPFHNAFSDLVVDAEGNVWAAGVLENQVPGSGFYRLSAGGDWTDFTAARVPELAGRSSFERIYVDPQGTAWAGSAGGGLIEVRTDGTVVVHDERNSTLQQPQGEANRSFILVGGIASDAGGNLWVTNRGALAKLHVRTPDGEWTGLSSFTCNGVPLAGVTFDRILIDSFGQKWIVAVDENNYRRNIGVIVLDTRGTPTNSQDDGCRFFGTRGSGGQDLPGIAVTSIVEDRDGTIWIGTEEGLAFVINSGIVADDPSAVPVWPQYADRSEGVFILYGVRINDLAVDPANRIWVATDQGAYLLQQAAGGFEIARIVASENSPLFSDNIVSVVVEPRSGRVFFATDRGLISFEGDAISPVEKAGDLFVYPNPVDLAGGAEPAIFIEGLVEATELRILAPHGALVARLSARGGRTRWDGRDVNGRLVPSGVYLVVAVGENGEGTAYGKVAVIR